MKFAYGTLGFAVLALIGGSGQLAFAESSQNPFEAIDGDKGVKNPWDDMKTPDQALGGGSGTQAGFGAPPVSDKEKAKQDADEISRNFDKALSNYESIMKDEKNAAVRNLENRIKENEKLLSKNQTKLEEYRAAVRKLKIEYTREILNAKNMLATGRISQEVYDQRAKRLADEYVFKNRQLEKDVGFYSKETQETATRLSSLGDQHRFHKVSQTKDRAREDDKKLNPLEELAIELGGPHQFQLRDVWEEPDCRFCQIR